MTCDAVRITALLSLALALATPAFADDYPITLTGVTDADFVSMRQKVGALEDETAAHYGETFEQVESLTASRTYVRGGVGSTRGDVVEITTSRVPVSFRDFVASISPSRWGPNLASYVGGEIRPFGEDRQIERMVLAAPGKDQDMTKIEEVVWEWKPDGTPWRITVYWEVLKSDNGTVVRDIGSIRFANAGPKTTRVTTHSGHRFGGFPFDSAFVPTSIKESLTAASLKYYFKKHGKKYRETAIRRTRERRRRAQEGNKDGLADLIQKQGR